MSRTLRCSLATYRVWIGLPLNGSPWTEGIVDLRSGEEAILERCMALPAFSDTHPLAVKATTLG